jgi:hypothetical protein
MTTNYAKKAVNYTNGRKIFQMIIKITAFSIPRPSKFYKNWDFWFENKPSGNPAPDFNLETKNSFEQTGRRFFLSLSQFTFLSLCKPIRLIDRLNASVPETVCHVSAD